MNRVRVLTNTKNRVTVCSINSASGRILKIMESRVSNRCLRTMCVHNSVISNSHNVEAAPVSIRGRMDDIVDVITYIIYMYTYIIALKRNNFLTYTATWVNLWPFAK